MASAGRPKGSVSRNKQRLMSLLRQQYGADFHPIMKMAKHAVELDKQAEVGDVSRMEAISAWDKVAQYTEPKMKALEVSGEITDGRDKSELIGSIESVLSRRASGVSEQTDRRDVH